MRVLQIGPYPPPYGGVQTNLVAIRFFLLERGIPCAVINVTRHRKPESEDVYYPSSPAGVLRLLAKLDYDIIHYHFGGMLSQRVLALAMACTLRPGTRSILTFHSGGFPSTLEGKATGPNSRAAVVLRRFDGLISVNEEIVSFLQKLRIPAQKLRLIPPYSSMDNPRPVSLPAALEAFFDTHGPVLISAGQLEPEYNLLLQIEAMKQVCRQFPDAGLLLLGSGSSDQDLRLRIEALHLANHILLAGDIPHEATLEAISRADVMLRTTLYDGDSISVREALHAGTPVIATDNAMRPPGVRLIPKSDLVALVRAIAMQLAQAKLEPTTGAADETNLQAVLDFYKELLATK